MAARPLPKTFSREELDALLDVPNLAAPTGLRNRALLELAVRTGLRASELCGLHLRDIRWAEHKILVRGEIAKGGREAVVYLDERTEAWLERWTIERARVLKARGAKASACPHLFTTLDGGPLDRRYLFKMIGRYARRAGIDRPVGPHMLRHTFGTTLLAEGFNLRQVQELMRHADIRTTTVYTHVSDAELAARIRSRAA